MSGEIRSEDIDDDHDNDDDDRQSIHLRSGGSSSSRSRHAVIEVIQLIHHLGSTKQYSTVHIIFLRRLYRYYNRAPNRLRGTMKRCARISRMSMDAIICRIIRHPMRWVSWEVWANKSDEIALKYVKMEYNISLTLQLKMFFLLAGPFATTNPIAADLWHAKSKHDTAFIYATHSGGVLSETTFQSARKRYARYCERHHVGGYGGKYSIA